MGEHIVDAYHRVEVELVDRLDASISRYWDQSDRRGDEINPCVYPGQQMNKFKCNTSFFIWLYTTRGDVECRGST